MRVMMKMIRYKERYELWKLFQKRLNLKLNPSQIEIAKNILRFPKTTDITWCRGSGKSFVVGYLAYFFAYVFGWTVIITAPTLKQTWHIMKNVHDASDKMGGKKKKRNKRVNYDNRYELVLRGRGQVICLSGDKTSQTQGEHGHILIADEKQDLDSAIFSESFIPMLGHHHGITILSGIGGSPESLGEVLGKQADYRHELPWWEYVKYDKRYIEEVEYNRRQLLPEEFKAHFECKPLTMSDSILIPRLIPGGKFEGNSRTVCGIDWGKKIDKSVASLAHFYDNKIHFDEWLVAHGNYKEQVDQIADWLNSDLIEWDEVVAEENGVGAVADFLQDKIPQVQIKSVTTDWKNAKAREMHALSVSGNLIYNKEHELGGVFEKEMKGLHYKVLGSKNIEVDHSDFYSSAILTMEEEKVAYL